MFEYKRKALVLFDYLYLSYAGTIGCIRMIYDLHVLNATLKDLEMDNMYENSSSSHHALQLYIRDNEKPLMQAKFVKFIEKRTRSWQPQCLSLPKKTLFLILKV
jgi:hypothetical protein